MSADHGSVAKELEKADKEFKEFERKDIKYREDLKHTKTKLKKLQEKLTKDLAKMEVGLLLTQLLHQQMPCWCSCCLCRHCCWLFFFLLAVPCTYPLPYVLLPPLLP